MHAAHLSETPSQPNRACGGPRLPLMDSTVLRFKSNNNKKFSARMILTANRTVQKRRKKRDEQRSNRSKLDFLGNTLLTTLPQLSGCVWPRVPHTRHQSSPGPAISLPHQVVFMATLSYNLLNNLRHYIVSDFENALKL